jgi:hypothetical protein
LNDRVDGVAAVWTFLVASCGLLEGLILSFINVQLVSFFLSREKSKEGSAELCKDEEQHIMSGHLRAPLAAIAEIMLQSLSKNAPDLPTHLSLSLSLSLSLCACDFCDAISPS